MKQPFERSVSLIRSCVERGLIPSAALAMGIGDEVMVKECWGVTSVTEDAQPVNSQTLYDMASVSKIYATTMITLRFIERGADRSGGDGSLPAENAAEASGGGGG